MASPVVPRVDTHSTRVDVINSQHGRILCVADVRGAISSLNSLAAEHNAVAVIHSGDFGFYEPSSIASISDRTLKHLVQYSSLISPQFRSQLLSPSTSPNQLRQLLSNGSDFVLSEFPKLVSGEIQLSVPVYTVYGACEDIAILEKIRLAAPSALSVPSDPSAQPPLAPATTTSSSGPTSGSAPPTSQSSYSIPNLTVLDEATTRVLNIGGIRLRLFGLGGAVVPHKLFDNGAGTATIAGGMGTMWTTMLQIGELVDTAQKVYDPSETRLLITHASPGREGLISQLSLALKADLTVSAGLHFRYGVSYNEFSVTWDPETFRQKLEASRKAFGEVWDAVKTQVEGVVDENQKALLTNALAVANRVPATAPVQGGPAAEETAWKNCWNWNLPDAAFGSLVLDIREGRIGSEMKSQGFNFAYRSQTTPSASANPSNVAAAAPTRAAPAPSSAPNSTQQHSASAPQHAAARPFAPGNQAHRGGFAPHQQGRGPRGGPHFQHQQQQLHQQQQNAPSAAVVAESSDKKDTSQTAANGTQPPAPAASPAPVASASTPVAPPTGPRNHLPHQQQNRPPSRSNLARNHINANANTSAASSTPPPGGVSKNEQPQSSAVEETTKGGAKPSAAETSAAPNDGTSDTAAVTSPSTGERGSGRGGRSGRSRGGGGGGRGGANAEAASRGRSNGEWTRRGGRGGGGAKQANGGDAGSPAPGAGGAGTPTPTGGEKSTAA
ncbi:hypothetical protein JCM11491_002231 [Sporobolomyces phaffii]